jgi:hypothetical protein
VHPLQGKTGGSQCVLDLGLQQDGEEQSSKFSVIASHVHKPPVRSGIVMKDKDIFHVSVRTKSMDALSQQV